MIDDSIDDMSGMDKKALRTAYLISGYMQQTLTEREKIELDDWINQSRQNLKLFEELTDPGKVEKYAAIMQQMNKKRIRDKIDQRIYAGNLLNRPIIKWVIAASIIGITIITFFIFFKSAGPTINPDIAGTVIIKPGSDRATLKLSDGSVMILDSMQNGMIKNEKGVVIRKSADGQVEYTNDTVPLKEEAFNTISTPRGGQYRVTLSDGTKAWLNAASSIKYPVVFNDTVRKVEITGEVYFEVTKDKTKPFKVTVNDVAVEVLGTRFNINGYGDEPGIKVSLVEGIINVSSKHKSSMMHPGQQATINSAGDLDLMDKDMDEVTAWKEGYFRWKKENIQDIMRQVARWYDVDVVYKDDIRNENFGGIVSRKDSISKVLKIMESTATIHFKTEGKKIIVIK